MWNVILRNDISQNDFISSTSGGPNKACSTRTWGNDSSKPRAIPAHRMLKVSVKIYNILLSTINTPIDVFSKNFHFDVPESKFLSWSGFLNMSLYSKHRQSSQFIGIFMQIIHRLSISWFFGSEQRWCAQLWKKDYFCCDSNYNWFGSLAHTRRFLNKCVMKEAQLLTPLAHTQVFFFKLTTEK